MLQNDIKSCNQTNQVNSKIPKIKYSNIAAKICLITIMARYPTKI